MKKLLLTALLGLAVSVSMSAQIFVGGQLGINATRNTDKNVNPVVTTSNTTVSVLPNVGYILNDKMLVGARVGLNFGSTGANNSTFGLGLQPYLRYKVLNIGKFSLAAEANVGIATSTTTNKIGGVGVNKVSNFNFSLGAVPVVLYQLNEHIALEADINVLNFDLGFGSVKETNTPEGGNAFTVRDEGDFNLGLGANSNNIFGAGLGAVIVGFTYAF